MARVDKKATREMKARLIGIVASIKAAKDGPQLMDAALSLIDAAGDSCSEDELELLDLDTITDPIIAFLSDVEDLETV